MIDLSARQVQILRAIIEEFISSADSVGSDTIDRKYQIGVSPATIRNEMVELTDKGYLKKHHTSSGRAPTSKALKLYVHELVRERELSVADEVSVKEKVWQSRNELDKLLQSATKVLADKTKALGLSLSNQNSVFASGYANLLEMPEFDDVVAMKAVLKLIEEAQKLQAIFDYGTSENAVHVVYGDEVSGSPVDLGVIFTQVEVHGSPTYLAVLGSPRFQYAQVLPLMKYFRGLIVEMVG